METLYVLHRPAHMVFSCLSYKQLLLSIINSQIHQICEAVSQHLKLLYLWKRPHLFISYVELVSVFYFPFLFTSHGSCSNFLPSTQAKNVDGIQFPKCQSLLSPLPRQNMQHVLIIRNRTSEAVGTTKTSIYQPSHSTYLYCFYSFQNEGFPSLAGNMLLCLYLCFLHISILL